MSLPNILAKWPTNTHNHFCLRLKNVYDCHMEEIAGHSEDFVNVKDFGVNFSKKDVPDDGMLRGVIEEILQSWATSDALLQVCIPSHV
ncbi:hypothetical protein Y032_0034g2840 [Ancylostoma ceylanicum]|uniref:Uncharacterized protein n=1 Tax=Ancylostoma ceylanicum TaxID=53326 RepID=A0A016UMM9_9BILA|nr:hypothetical protein Y032_0034g2840 [Ancylostoma ceylanicum]